MRCHSLLQEDIGRHVTLQSACKQCSTADCLRHVCAFPRKRNTEGKAYGGAPESGSPKALNPVSDLAPKGSEGSMPEGPVSEHNSPSVIAFCGQYQTNHEVACCHHQTSRLHFLALQQNTKSCDTVGSASRQLCYESLRPDIRRRPAPHPSDWGQRGPPAQFQPAPSGQPRPRKRRMDPQPARQRPVQQTVVVTPGRPAQQARGRGRETAAARPEGTQRRPWTGPPPHPSASYQHTVILYIETKHEATSHAIS